MSGYADLIREIRDRLSCHGAAECECLDRWQEEFDAVAADGDDEACALLVDVLVAFDKWQADERPADPAGADR